MGRPHGLRLDLVSADPFGADLFGADPFGADPLRADLFRIDLRRGRTSWMVASTAGEHR